MMSSERVIVGLSGGVDSAVTAALLVKRGFDVVGVTLKLYEYTESLEDLSSDKKECHPLSFITDAKAIAEQLGIDHHVIDHQDLFREVIIDPFLSAYEKGDTPLPCVRCNRDVKTAALYHLLQPLKATKLATGHYVRDVWVDNMVQLHQGMDPQRDQSFFLFALTLGQLQHLMFPLGHFSKDQTRAYAEEIGLPVAHKKASQNLCFIAKRSYQEYLSDHTTHEIKGEIFHEDGRFLGHHPGIRYYTIGQRQGLGIGGTQEPLYVTQIDSKTQRITVGPRSALARHHIHLHQVNWLAPDLQDSSGACHEVLIKIRSAGRPIPARLTLKGQEASVYLPTPEYGVAPGQACVFYQGTRLLGGGWIYASA